ncbi:hypothetical protein E2C01_029786 [Portunus trituberculatus]|uniref:Uncharacterized protein n=1 Tax=Portunus trituberculatus TaxID=210409 RepID=A0A5B7EP90_PORTR|nr:hypothetical protein [Portunus trituberculatus]
MASHTNPCVHVYSPSLCLQNFSKSGNIETSGGNGQQWGGQRGAGSPSHPSQTPSPAGSVGSEGSQSSGYTTSTEGRSKAGASAPPVGHTPPHPQPPQGAHASVSMVSVPVNIHTLIMKQNCLSSHLASAHDMWMEADEYVSKNNIKVGRPGEPPHAALLPAGAGHVCEVWPAPHQGLAAAPPLAAAPLSPALGGWGVGWGGTPAPCLVSGEVSAAAVAAAVVAGRGGAASLLDPDTQGRTLISYSSVVQSDGVKLLWVVPRPRCGEGRGAEGLRRALRDVQSGGPRSRTFGFLV